MRLISCHIENFGKLQNFDYNFSNKTIIHEVNGWGKSTLATFIRVMFYGFIGENKRNITDNERKKFRPWQSGRYGGSLTFSVDGKEYRMERSFGDKKSGTDSFELYDNTTNLRSNDYDSDIGEKLFGIDIESFMRTVFIAQQDCGTEITSDISAKIGNVSDQTADMGNYDMVQTKLKDESNHLTPDRATGTLNKLQNRISELKEKIRNKGIYEDNLNALNEKIAEEANEKSLRENELEKIQEEISKLATIKDAAGEIEQYREICAQVETAQKKVEEKRNFFSKEIPSQQDVEANIELWGQLEAYRQNENNNLLTQEELNNLSGYEQMFSSGHPSEAELVEVEKKIQNFSDLNTERDKSILSDAEKKRIEDAKAVFAKYTPAIEEIDTLNNIWADRKSKKDVLNTKRANAELMKQNVQFSAAKSGSISTLAVMLIVLAVVLVLSGVALHLVFSSTIVLGVCIVIGVGLLIAGILSAGKKNAPDPNDNDLQNKAYLNLMSEIEADEVFIAQTENKCKELFGKLGIEFNEYDVPMELSKIRGYRKDYDELLERSKQAEENGIGQAITELKSDIKRYFEKYAIQVSGMDFGKAYYQLSRSVADYLRIVDKKGKFDQAHMDAEAIQSKVKDFIETSGFTVTNDIKAQLNDIKEQLTNLKFLNNDLEEKATRKRTFEEEHDVSELASKKAEMDTSVSMEELNTSFNSMKITIEDIANLENQYKVQRDENAEKYNECVEYENELINAQEEYDYLLQKYQIIEKTRKYMEVAKERFSGKYMDDIQNAFEKYRMIITDSKEKYELDANLNIKVREQGSLHDIESLSEGYQDLVGLCRRMAMVEAMYDKEKPFLVFDDPFVNLDDTRLQGAKDFLDKLSEQYQIIYFSCHQSRC